MTSLFKSLRCSLRIRSTVRFLHTSPDAGAPKKTVRDLVTANQDIFKGTPTLVRVDFNVPFSRADPRVITDDTRIREALPTIDYLVKHGAKVVLTSHCGRPKGKPNPAMSLLPAAERLEELLGSRVQFASDCVGPVAEKAVNELEAGDVLLLENARFHLGEEKNDSDFSKQLAHSAKIYVNDAFGTAHRAHASTVGVTNFIATNVAGFLLEKEIKFLRDAVTSPKRPFAAIVGGAKVSSKISVIGSLIQKCDKVFIGGGMMFTFYKAKGLSIGASLVEEDYVDKAKDLIELAERNGVKLLLPPDVVVAKEFDANSEFKQVEANAIPDGWMGMDIGPKSIELFEQELSECQTIVWNGPMGVFEFKEFAKGTIGVASSVAKVKGRGGISIVGGGDSVSAIHMTGVSADISHISTGGGASLEMLEGIELPGVVALDNL